MGQEATCLSETGNGFMLAKIEPTVFKILLQTKTAGNRPSFILHA